MRPKSIVWFERIYVVSVVLANALMFREWRVVAVVYGEQLFFVLMLTLLLIIPVTLALLVSRRGSRVALAQLVLMTWLIGAFFAASYSSGFQSRTDVAVFAFQAVAVAATFLPFTPSARAWLRTPRTVPVSPDALRRTFD